MKYIVIIFFGLTFNKIYAQKNQSCLVKYRDYKTNATLGTHNHWFLPDKYVSNKEPNYRAIYLKGFPVLTNEGMTTQTDTIKYNKEFNEFIQEAKENDQKRKQSIWMMYYNSNVNQMTYYYDYINKNYIVLDTLEKMNTWEILNDTATILGFKCQQAVINYKQDKFYAWFTMQLPFNAGPEGFRGLPGLILKVSNVSAKVGYEAVEIQYPNKEAIPLFDNVGENITKKEYLVIINERNKKMYESMNNMMDQLKKQGAKQNNK